jgi:adenylate cyclase
MTETIGAVFLSYATQDAEAARRICEALRAAGIQVWFDQSELRGGDAWDQKIRQQVRDCSLFVPVISANTASRPEGYFRLEWDLADRRTHMIARDRAFIVPVCIDATSELGTDVPESFARVQWTRLRDGQPSTAFVVRLSGLVSGRGPTTGSPTPAEASVPPIAGADPSAPDVAAIAVRPFTDMSPGRDQDHICEGIAEELIDALTQVEGLRVAARSSSFQFREAGLDVRQAGRQLGVGSLLHGSVRKSGDRLRITVQLVEVTSGYHKWSERFEREVGDVFAIQDEIAVAVSSVLRGGKISARERSAIRWQPTDMGTYEYFLRGRQYMHRLQQPYMDQSRDLFERAIALDSQYAPAWAGLATVRGLLYEWWGCKDEDLREADRASRIAMELAPELADAHVARGVALSLNRRYEEAQQHYETAARLNPNLFEAYYYYGRAAFAYGDIERSAELFRKASEVRQEDFQSPALQAQSLRRLGRNEEARVVIREAVVRAERVLALNPLDGRALSMGAGVLYYDGQTERAFEWARRAELNFPDDAGVLLNGACLRAKTGLKDEAIHLLERVLSKGWGKRDWIERDQDYDSLRDDPRFKAMLERIR